MEEATDLDIKPCLSLLEKSLQAESSSFESGTSVDVKQEQDLGDSSSSTGDATEFAIEVKQEVFSPVQTNAGVELDTEGLGNRASFDDKLHEPGPDSSRAVQDESQLRTLLEMECETFDENLERVVKNPQCYSYSKDAESDQQYVVELNANSDSDEETEKEGIEDELLTIHFEGKQPTDQVDPGARVAYADIVHVKEEIDNNTIGISTDGHPKPKGKNSRLKRKRRRQDTGSVFPPNAPRPCPMKFFSNLVAVAPNAVALTAVFMHVKVDNTPALKVKSPVEKLEFFKRQHKCYVNCPCSKVFCTYLTYLPSEISHIERVTLGQASNPNWQKMRKQIFTPCIFGTIFHSSDLQRTASEILARESQEDSELSSSELYERRTQRKALALFSENHEQRHKSFKLQKCGLSFSDNYPYLASSADARGVCSCGDFVLLVKSLWRYRNFHPRAAAKLSGMLAENAVGALTIQSENLHCQLQGEMGLTGVKKAIVIFYTNKGIFPIKVPYSQKTWADISSKLESFYHSSFYSILFPPKTNKS